MNNTNLHVYYLLRNITSFKKYLDGTEHFDNVGSQNGKTSGGNTSSSTTNTTASGKPGSSSGPKSWNSQWLTSAPKKKPDPNIKDSLGRTVLHLVCSTVDDPKSFDYLSILLNNPYINVNIQDNESGWTPLHRAMWCGNLRAARDLMARGEIDLGIKDFEGLTPFDLFNSTCQGTNPIDGAVGTHLYTWGSNKNYSLGAGDSTDRALPDKVTLLNRVQAAAAATSAAAGKDTRSSSSLDTTRNDDHNAEHIEGDVSDDQHHEHSHEPPRYDSAKFARVGVQDVAMARFHTGVLTTEDRGNLSLAGFGSNARCALGSLFFLLDLTK